MRTQAEFFAALAKCRNGWKIGRALGSIRHGLHCPVTAVAESETGEEFEISQYQAAADTLGLPKGLADRIANAADCHGRHCLGSCSAEPRLRKRILAALGLSEATS